MPDPLAFSVPSRVETRRLVLRPFDVEDAPALHEALVESLEELRRHLWFLQVDADTRRSGVSMKPPTIYEAAVFGDRALVDRLLAADPQSVNAADAYGFTPLHGIVQEHHFELAEFLIAKGANVMARNDSGVTPLHLAAYPEMVDILVKHGADLEAREDGGGTPLHLASENPDAMAVMRRLLELGADPNATDDAGGTALSSALERGEPEKVELLLAFGARRDHA